MTGSATADGNDKILPAGEVIRMVQATLEEAEFFGGGGAGVVHEPRTDAGVHAKGQVACFDYRGQVPVERLAVAIGNASQKMCTHRRMRLRT